MTATEANDTGETAFKFVHRFTDGCTLEQGNPHASILTTVHYDHPHPVDGGCPASCRYHGTIQRTGRTLP